MPISGLMITLDADPAVAAVAIDALAACPAVELGVREAQRLAAVLDVPTEDDNKARWRWLNDLPGVTHVDVVFVSIDADASAPSPTLPPRKEVASS